MKSVNKHPTWLAIPEQYRSEWYRLPGFTQQDRRGGVTLVGAGFIAQSDIPGICSAGERFEVGSIVPYRIFDMAAKQGRLRVFFSQQGAGGYGVESIMPDDNELDVLYERFPAMRPPKNEPTKKVGTKKETETDIENEDDQ